MDGSARVLLQPSRGRTVVWMRLMSSSLELCTVKPTIVTGTDASSTPWTRVYYCMKFKILTSAPRGRARPDDGRIPAPREAAAGADRLHDVRRHVHAP